MTVSVLEVREGGRILVDGSGLYRTLVNERVVEELVPYEAAIAAVDAYNEVAKSGTCRMVSYCELAQMASI